MHIFIIIKYCDHLNVDFYVYEINPPPPKKKLNERFPKIDMYIFHSLLYDI